jgi:uncharacterized protein
MNTVYVKKSAIDANGVFAAKSFSKGEIVGQISGKIKKMRIRSQEGSTRFRDWIGIGMDTWIIPNPKIWRFLNHSCNPSTAIVDDRYIIALRDVKADDEITFDYSLTDDDPHQLMNCLCGSNLCRGVIKSIRETPTDVFMRHFPHVPSYFQKIFIKTYVDSTNAKDQPI